VSSTSGDLSSIMIQTLPQQSCRICRNTQWRWTLPCLDSHLMCYSELCM
jgi:hypothetical protein